MIKVLLVRTLHRYEVEVEKLVTWNVLFIAVSEEPIDYGLLVLGVVIWAEKRIERVS